MHEPSAAAFERDSADALANPQLRRNFRLAMDGLMAKRRNQFPLLEDTEALRELARRIRKNAIRKLPELLEQLEANCQKNGIRVHWAETVEDANRIVLTIAQRHRARYFVKGKSMVSEEMELNHYLEAHGIESLESDLGEYIVQLNQELPSHIIMPAIHLNKGQISDLFEEKGVSSERTESAEEMTALAREVLRRKFHDAHLGISGVNFAVAETGTLCLVENEGNGRFCTTLPPVHVALMGIEKVVDRLEEVPPLLSLLTRSATGQPITTYFNMITSPRKEGELDGPQEVHLVLLDNGRSRMYGDELLQDTLMCIRCGACINHCPVYARIGGHAYRSVYPGPIGKILTPQMKGLLCIQPLRRVRGGLPGQDSDHRDPPQAARAEVGRRASGAGDFRKGAEGPGGAVALEGLGAGFQQPRTLPAQGQGDHPAWQCRALQRPHPQGMDLGAQQAALRPKIAPRTHPRRGDSGCLILPGLRPTKF